MTITKTKFINYIRCPRYAALDNLKRNQLDSEVTLIDYRQEEIEAYKQEILDDMYDEEGNDLIDVEDAQLEVMLPYFNQVEQLAGRLASKYFDGKFIYSTDTLSQESFDTNINGIKYLCYVDILNEVNNGFNIIEAKATTAKTFLELEYTLDGEKVSIFAKNVNGIYQLKEELGIPFDQDKYLEQKSKMYNRFSKSGHYIYDLAVQRYIIEHDLKTSNRRHLIKDIKYYLAVLNSDYIYQEKVVNGNREYDTDLNGEEIITYFDMTNVTKDLMDQIDLHRQRVETYVKTLAIDPCSLDIYCEHKKTTKCKYIKECWKQVPAKNSVFSYIDNGKGFEDQQGVKYSTFDLVNDGKVNMLDIPLEMLSKQKQIIQRNVVETKIPYVDYAKIKAGIAQITYPLYHLDFETFPGPLPRFNGEKCYSQSVFQFSLHIEAEANICDKDKNHYSFLAKDHFDHRLELIEEMCRLIDTSKPGTILVYNASFEKTRLKELANIFPEYKNQLLKMRDMIFDLMDIVKTRSSLYEEIGFDEERAKLFNYYHTDMSGSFSIKKILPIFSSLSYDKMEVANGMDAIVTYANFPKMSQEEYKHKYNKLVEYCKQDTWAMVEILHGLDLLSKSVKK